MIVVFDVDGTLVDMRGLHTHVMVEVLSKYGVKVSEKDVEDVSRQSLNLFLMKVLPSNMWGRLTEIVSRYVRELARNASKIKLREGAIEALEAIPEKKAIFTLLSRPIVDTILKNLKIAKYFEVVVTSDDVNRPKPDPEGLLLISNKLNDDNLVVVGDSRMDVLAAKKVDAVSVVVGNNIPEADYIISSLRELPEVIENIRVAKRSVFKV